MKHIDLLDELFLALASLPARLPRNVLRVFVDSAPRGGCLRCQLDPARGHLRSCRCAEDSELVSRDSLVSPIPWMGLRLVVEADGCHETGYVLVRIGVSRSTAPSHDRPEPFVEIRGGHVERNPATGGVWGRGQLADALLANVFDEAIACGCRDIEHQNSGEYVRADTGEPIGDFRRSRMFDTE